MKPFAERPAFTGRSNPFDHTEWVEYTFTLSPQENIRSLDIATFSTRWQMKLSMVKNGLAIFLLSWKDFLSRMIFTKGKKGERWKELHFSPCHQHHIHNSCFDSAVVVF